MCLFSTGFLAPAASMLAIGFINCENRGVAIAMFCVGEGLSSFSRCDLYTICMELAPRFVIYFISKYTPTHTIDCTYVAFEICIYVWDTLRMGLYLSVDSMLLVWTCCSLPPVTENSTREKVFFCY